MPVRVAALMSPLQHLPRRIFLDSCTAQTLRRYGAYVYEGEPIEAGDRIHSVTDGIAKVGALRSIVLVNQRAMFEWIVSQGSMVEARAKRDRGHMQWLRDIADHSQVCIESDGPSPDSVALGERLSEPRFGYLSSADRRLIHEAVVLRCDAFLTVERRLPTNAAHLEKHLGIRILTPIQHWEALRPWAALWT
jgi:hypothetical protein